MAFCQFLSLRITVFREVTSEVSCYSDSVRRCDTAEMEREFIVVLILATPVIVLAVLLLRSFGHLGAATVLGGQRRHRDPFSVVIDSGNGYSVMPAGCDSTLTKEQDHKVKSKGSHPSTHVLPENLHWEIEDTLFRIPHSVIEEEETVMSTGAQVATLKTDVAIPELDEDGYMLHPETWTEEIAERLARGQVPGSLTQEHWKIIYYLRDYYLEFGYVPPVRKLCRDTGLSLRRIYTLFPGKKAHGISAGLARCACKIAGIPALSFKQYP